MSESDGIDEPLEQVLQHGMAISAQIGREVSRIWEQQMAQKAQLSEREARRLQMAFDSEKRTALAVLKPTDDAGWWDRATPADVVEAYRVASAWKDQEPAAAASEKMLREQAQARFGIDGDELYRRSQEAPVRVKSELAQATEWAVEHKPAAYEHFSMAVNSSDTADGRRSAERALIRQWKHAQSSPAETEVVRQTQVRAAQDRDEGDQQRAAAASAYAQAERARDSVVGAEFDGPSAAEEAWYRDTFLTDSPEALQAESKAADVKASAERREHAGDRATVRAGAAYDSAERQAALATRMRAAGAPEKGIEARTFAEGQQKFPIGHAAAGRGKSVTKVKTNTPQKARAAGKQRGR